MSGIVSIGYEGRTVDELLDRLVWRNVEVLVDVRLNPLSRKPGLSKRKLGDSLARVDIEYVHMPELGNPRDNREPFWSGVVADGCSRFESMIDNAPASQEALANLTQLAQTHIVAVLCVERDHERCHRQVLTRLVAERAQSASIVYA